jgi:hypothetical protein
VDQARIVTPDLHLLRSAMVHLVFAAPEVSGYDQHAFRMSQNRIMIRVPEEIAAKAQRAAQAGQVESASAYFARLAAA